MDTQVRTPQAIFMQPQRLLVPLFQRPYVWNEEKQWEPLWRDVERVANRFLATPHTFNQPHFLGAIVLQQMASQTSDLQQRTVIDGQQRLTTLQVLLDAIHSEIVLIGVKTPAARIEPLIENAEAFCKKPEDRFKVWPTNRDREAFNEVMAAPSPVQYDELDHKGHRLVRAHRYFAEQCRDWLAAKGAEHIAERAEGLERTARDLLQLVVIDLTANEDAQEIFETLNARGTPLTAADLIKNFVFQRLLEQGADVEAAYAHYWQQFETAFWEKEVSLGRTVYPRSSVFLNHWLISQTGEEIVAREVFSRFKTFVDYDAQKAMSELLKDIHRASEIYRQFIECSEVSEGAIDRIALFGYRSKTMESEVVKPVVLALLDHKNGKPSDSVLNLALDTIESWLTRRMLVKATTKNYNTILTEVVNIVRQGDNSQPGKTIQSYFASQQSESGYWPDDQEVRNALLTLPIYRKISRSRLRMVLEAYEDHRRAWTPGKVSYAGVRIKRSAYAIEHLMPQSWHKHWKLNPSFTEDERERRIHCLGNLTLLSKRLNSKISNGPWPGKEGKVQSLIKNDVLLMNSELVNEHAKTWNELDIDTRTTQMIDSILQIWPVPEGHKSVIKRAAETGKSYVEVADLLADGLLQPGQILCSRPGKFGGHTAVVLSDGRLDYQGTVFDSPSAAGTAVRKRPTNGWIFWHLDEHGTKRLAHIRQEYRERLALESDESEEDEETD